MKIWLVILCSLGLDGFILIQSHSLITNTDILKISLCQMSVSFLQTG